jgi:hypothetical protein
LKNIVNRLTTNGANGIQIEQSARARSIRWQDIADAVADVYTPKLGLGQLFLARTRSRLIAVCGLSLHAANRPVPSRSGVGFVDRIACPSGSSFVLDCANDRREYGAASASGDHL